MRPPICSLCAGHGSISTPEANVPCPRCRGYLPFDRMLATFIPRVAIVNQRPALLQEDGQPLMYLN